MKIKYYLSIPLLGLFAACDPAIDEVDSKSFYTENELASSVLISQPYAEYPDILSFTTSPAKSVQILDETGAVIASGTACDSFKLAPGVSGNLLIRALSQTGKIIETTKTITVSKYTNVPQNWYYITGNTEGVFTGSAEWVWDEESCGACWGNGGYLAGSSTPNGYAGKWWGAKIAELPGQLNHAVGGVLTGEESADAKMVFSGGSVTKYAGDGSVIATGAFSISDIAGDGNKVGELKTTNNVVLWPYQINGGGVYVNSFEVTYIDENYMQLVYAKSGTGSWSECTWWEFKKKGVGAYVAPANPTTYEKWTNDSYSIIDASSEETLDGGKETAVDGDKLTFSYVSLSQDFLFKAKTVEASETLIVPDDAQFVDITPANAKIYEIVGEDTTAKTQTGTDAFDALTSGRYDVSVTYDKETKKYSVYYKTYDVSQVVLSIVDSKGDTVSVGEKSVSGSVTTYTFKDVTFAEDAKEFYFSNLKKEAEYKEVFDFSNITLLKGDDKIFEAGSVADEINLIKLASTVKEPVTIVLSIYEQANGTKAVYMSATGTAE